MNHGSIAEMIFMKIITIILALFSKILVYQYANRLTNIRLFQNAFKWECYYQRFH